MVVGCSATPAAVAVKPLPRPLKLTLPPLLTVLSCCTVVATVLVTRCGASVTGTTIEVVAVSVQPIELRVLHAEFYDCCMRHQAAASSPELPLLYSLAYL
ncbi:hypothetical protein AHAS_Ahas15G0238400 [Arachis hypogaea]